MATINLLDREVADRASRMLPPPRAGDAMLCSQSASPAAVSLDAYAAQIQRQSICSVHYTRKVMGAGFAGFIIHHKVPDQPGAAMNSGRAIIIYGQRRWKPSTSLTAQFPPSGTAVAGFESIEIGNKSAWLNQQG